MKTPKWFRSPSWTQVLKLMFVSSNPQGNIGLNTGCLKLSGAKIALLPVPELVNLKLAHLWLQDYPKGYWLKCLINLWKWDLGFLAGLDPLETYWVWLSLTRPKESLTTIAIRGKWKYKQKTSKTQAWESTEWRERGFCLFVC